MTAPAHVLPKARPQAKPKAAPRTPKLEVVEPRRRLRTGPTVVLGAFLAFVIAFGLVVAHALLVQGQERLDDVQQQVVEAAREQQELRLQVAQQESPEVIVDAATDLGMVPPEGVTYLTPSGAVTAGAP
jgi:cell division protein FtsL